MTSTPRGAMHEKKDIFHLWKEVLLKNNEICDEVSEVISIPSCHACIHPSIYFYLNRCFKFALRQLSG